MAACQKQIFEQFSAGRDLKSDQANEPLINAAYGPRFSLIGVHPRTEANVDQRFILNFEIPLLIAPFSAWIVLDCLPG